MLSGAQFFKLFLNFNLFQMPSLEALGDRLVPIGCQDQKDLADAHEKLAGDDGNPDPFKPITKVKGQQVGEWKID